ncbi:M15 family metallopeptidase [Nitratifractor sp.]
MIRVRTFFVLAAFGAFAAASCVDLVRAYPDFVAGCRGNRVLLTDGTSMRYDDGKRKDFQTLLNRPDLEDMFRFSYPRGPRGYGHAPAKNHDPGRIRYEPFFRRMYGNSAAEVRRHLTRIRWLAGTLKRPYFVTVTRVNGVDRHLAAVSRDLDRLLRRHPEYLKYLYPIGGTFKWRRIAGTRRLSVHSFGAAIDINVRHSAYWRWNKGPYRYRNEIPLPIVEAFERHGFIWGGKWYHYDTMHFEYRPELLRGASSAAKRHPDTRPAAKRRPPAQDDGTNY